jgi:hypothetical protein
MHRKIYEPRIPGIVSRLLCKARTLTAPRLKAKARSFCLLKAYPLFSTRKQSERGLGWVRYQVGGATTGASC